MRERRSNQNMIECGSCLCCICGVKGKDGLPVCYKDEEFGSSKQISLVEKFKSKLVQGSSGES